MRLNIVIFNNNNFLRIPSFLRFASLEFEDYECKKDII